MTTLLIVLIVIASFVLGVIVLIQNPKGGGLAGNIAGFSSQFMGVKQTNDVLEKGTWIFAGIICALSMLSVFFIPGGSSNSNIPDRAQDVKGAPVPTSSKPLPSNTLQLDPTTLPQTNPGTPPATTPNK
ncbi:MAG: preprotein translocase subunit SecG [Chitinophagaceae bacterium]|nr:preprotein translocase subunit SecG [Chitinophagaceae bacterium]MCB0740759.1 preprotein translocase subunit SecG [Chitinophagaceae bacterium]HQV07063.1 preprotein translocase subunit SecG [Chitinophagaceae bacterium]